MISNFYFPTSEVSATILYDFNMIKNKKRVNFKKNILLFHEVFFTICSFLAMTFDTSVIFYCLAIIFHTSGAINLPYKIAPLV